MYLRLYTMASGFSGQVLIIINTKKKNKLRAIPAWQGRRNCLSSQVRCWCCKRNFADQRLLYSRLGHRRVEDALVVLFVLDLGGVEPSRGRCRPIEWLHHRRIRFESRNSTLLFCVLQLQLRNLKRNRKILLAKLKWLGNTVFTMGSISPTYFRAAFLVAHKSLIKLTPAHLVGLGILSLVIKTLVYTNIKEYDADINQSSLLEADFCQIHLKTINMDLSLPELVINMRQWIFGNIFTCSLIATFSSLTRTRCWIFCLWFWWPNNWAYCRRENIQVLK